MLEAMSKTDVGEAASQYPALNTNIGATALIGQQREKINFTNLEASNLRRELIGYLDYHWDLETLRYFSFLSS